MTNTRKPVRRVTVEPYRVLWASGSKAREIIVKIGPGDFLEFREKGTRARFYCPIESAFRYAVKITAFKAMMDKANKKPKRNKRR